VTKIDTNASGAASLLYSTYLGGSYSDFGDGIAIDSSGNAYVTGYTYSPDFPTKNQYQTRQGSSDVFVVKLADTPLIGGRVTSDGSTGISGVTITLSGSQTATTVTDSTGNYSFTSLLLGGNYTVTPSMSGLTFFPSEQSFTDLRANQTNVNFSTQPPIISGHVTKNIAAGAGLPGVTVTLTSGTGFTPLTVNTARDGTYSFSNLPTPGNYTIKPSKLNYIFSPVKITLDNVTGSRTNKNFVATRTYTINGVVKLGTAGLARVTVELTSPTPAGFTTRTETTNSIGTYSFTNVPAGRDYTVTPTKSGYQFTPASTSLANLSNNQTVKFAVTVYNIVGRITRADTTTGISEVSVRLGSPTPAGFAAYQVLTDSTGTYTFTTVPAGRNYTIRPTKRNFTFTPTSHSITNLSNNIGAGSLTNFTGAGP
jgi:hypothetical protein